jgi:hypothetical protein
MISNAERGIILAPEDLDELSLYGAYAGMTNAMESWGVPG